MFSILTTRPALLLVTLVIGLVPTSGPVRAEPDHHDDHDDHGAHSEHSDGIAMSERDIAAFGIVVDTATAGAIDATITTTGEVRLNQDRLAHIVPRLTGVVRRVDAHLGDQVTTGDLLAVIDSRELAEAKADYLAAGERLALADATFEREAGLRGKGVSAEQEFLQARLGQAEARIALRTAIQTLYALGLTEEVIAHITEEEDAALTRFEIRAPFSGTIIAKHITLGEMLEPTEQIYTIADLASVWVDLSIYPSDVATVRAGHSALITTGPDRASETGTITYMAPVFDEATRTLLARVVLPNPSGVWRPGMFVSATVIGETHNGAVVVPRAAVVTVDDAPAVFVAEADRFEARPVRVGASTPTHIEVLAGLEAGDRFVSAGASVLKAELAKESFGDGHAH